MLLVAGQLRALWRAGTLSANVLVVLLANLPFQAGTATGNEYNAAMVFTGQRSFKH